jgi:hypothetical protein
MTHIHKTSLPGDEKNGMHTVEKHKFDKAEFKQDTFSTNIQYPSTYSPCGYDFCGNLPI